MGVERKESLVEILGTSPRARDLEVIWWSRRSNPERWEILEFMLIHEKLPQGHIYPQLTHFPANL
jgi:hypothetical protein